MARSLKKSLKILSLIVVIIGGLPPIIEYINGNSDGDNYEENSGTVISIKNLDNESVGINYGDIYKKEGDTTSIVVNYITNYISEGSKILGPKINEIIQDGDLKSKEYNINENESCITNSIGVDFIKISAGEFMMGSPSNEKYREKDEGPVHKVTIEKPFYLGKFEVTQGQWQKVMGNNPSTFKGEDLPVEGVSWNDAQEFVDKLNEMEKTDKYRLPSEAEWEYACRVGTNTKYFFGEDESKLGDYAWYLSNSNNETHPIGQKKPNAWGIYDIYGNVWEWVQDKWHEDYSSAPSDGSAWEGGVYSYVARGSSFRRTSSKEDPDFAGCRSANRGGNRDLITYDKGFRLLREL